MRYRSAVFVLWGLVSLASPAQIAHLDTLDARHDASMTLRERLDVMGSHSEALFARGRVADFATNALEMVDLAHQIGSDSLIAAAYSTVGTSFLNGSDVSSALRYFLLGREYAISAGDKDQVAASDKNLGVLYKQLGNYAEAIKSLKRAQEGQVRLETLNRIACHLSETYRLLGNPDSALIYAQRSNVFTDPKLDPYGYARSQVVLGAAYGAIGQQDQADVFFRRCITTCDSFNLVLPMSQALTAQANAQLAAGRPKAALIIGKRSLELASKAARLAEAVGADDVIWRSYWALGMSDSALSSMKHLLMLKDSLMNAEKLARMQNLVFQQRLKDMESEQAQREAEASRSRNIQFGIIALIVITLGIFLLVLSRTPVVGSRAIKNLSLIALLLFFEFINLLVHPVLGEFTHHSPILMLLCMAAIAALLIPLHHRMESLITDMLVRKNERVRLEAARRTIDEFEGRREEAK